MSDGFEFTLHSPLTKEDWSKLSDAELENTMSVTFQTPQGKQVKYIKSEVLDKIRAEIEKLQKMCDKNDLNLMAQYSAFGMVLDILDKYKAESEDKDA